MSEEIPALNSLRGKSWIEWTKTVGNHPDISVSEKVKRKIHPSVCLLPRKDILLYGCCPKMDVRVLSQCNVCAKVMMPSAFISHTRENHGPDQSQTSPVIAPGTSLLKKKFPHSKNKKKTILPPPVPPPPLFPRQATPPPSPIATAATEHSPPVLQPVQITKPASSPPITSLPSPTTNNPKHKKSKKSYKKIKEYDPDKHCGVVEGHKGPCLRSITCSNHMVLLRKAVSGRSKDFQQLIADHKAAKDKEASKQNQLPTLPKVEATSITTSQNATFRNVAPAFVKIAPTPQSSVTTTTSTATKSDAQVISPPLLVTVTSPAITSSNSQGNLENSSSVVYMPMSPLAVVSPLQLGGPILHVASTQPMISPPLGTQPVVVTIPVQNNNTPMYTTHPKPLIMSTCSTRKIGGTFVLQNQRIDRQRSEIQMVSNTRPITNACSMLNTHNHKPNILKNSTRSGNTKSSAVKRQAADKTVNDNKQIRLNDVNGFILHADVSETAEAPQSNNSVQDKITFMK